MRDTANTLARIRASLQGAKGHESAFEGKCPCHDDQAASLSVSRSEDGKILIHCHAGCGTRDVVKALGLEWADLFPANGKDKVTGNGTSGKRFDCAYDYRDADGKLVFQVVRFKPKSFAQRRPDPSKPGGWVWDLNGVERPLYRLAEVLEAKARGRGIFLCEGEKDADNVRALGLAATTNAGGAAKWTKHDANALQGANVIVLADNDAPGINGAWKKADTIPGAVVLLLPDLPPKGDVSDWISKGGTRNELERLARETRKKPPERPVEPSSEPRSPDEMPDPLSELANAHRFAEKYGGSFRHDPALGWLWFNGKRWASGEKTARRYAAKVGEVIRREALAIVDPDAARPYFIHAKRAESARGVEATLKLACCLNAIDATGIDWDADPWLLNCPNGTIDLRTGQIRAHRPADYITKLCPTPYRPESKSVAWIEHLGLVFINDSAMLEYFQFLAGYALTGSMNHQLFVVVHGLAGCGKSTTLEAIARVIGEDYGCAISHDVVLYQRHQGHACTMAALRGVRFGLVSELPSTARWNEATVKRLATGNSISARFIGQNPFTFQSTVKMFVDCNDRPDFNDPNGGIARRVRCIPFDVQLSGTDQCDRQIDRKLEAEAEGILAWMVQGAVVAFRGEPDIPERVRISSADYARQNDDIARFVDECCDLGETLQSEKGATFKAYREWGGTLSPKKLGSLLGAKFDEYRSNKKRYWIGFSLKE